MGEGREALAQQLQALARVDPAAAVAAVDRMVADIQRDSAVSHTAELAGLKELALKGLALSGHPTQLPTVFPPPPPPGTPRTMPFGGGYGTPPVRVRDMTGWVQQVTSDGTMAEGDDPEPRDIR